MPEKIKVNDQVSVGPQPSESDLNQLKLQGFESVVNFRTEGEEDQPVSPQEEKQVVEGARMQYLHLPVSMDSMAPERVDRFREQFQQLPKPVFAHCKSGKRAGAMVMMDVAVSQGMTGDQTLQKAQEMGFECDQPELKKMVRDYVDSRAEASHV
jgi:uncharacterized protein (TIGR01244 family)